MKQPQQLFQGMPEYVLGRSFPFRRTIVEVLFGELHVPVAELAPGKAIEGTGRFVEAIFGKGLIRLTGRLAETIRVSTCRPPKDRGPQFTESGSNPSRFIRVNRAAFQILLAKLR